MNIEFTTDTNVNKLDENGQKKLVLNANQWHLLSQLFSYTHSAKQNSHNAWMVDELDELIEKVEEGWE